MTAVLISLSGLPGVGKTTIARHVCRLRKAVHLRVDTIETSLETGPLKVEDVQGAGYAIAVALARDNLKLGLDVVADTVNPIAITRQWWRDAARDAGARLVDVEVFCSDKDAHRRRVETRDADIAGQTLPSWSDVTARAYEPWDTDVLRIDSGRYSAADCAQMIVGHVRAGEASFE